MEAKLVRVQDSHGNKGMDAAIVSIVFEQLTSTIAKQILEEVKQIKGASREIERLIKSFQAMKDVLIDAERRQLKDASVRGWLDGLKDVSYDVEDVLDEWNTMKLKEKIRKAGTDLRLTKKVSSIFLSPYLGIRKIVFQNDLARRLKGINKCLDDIAKHRERYNFNIIRSVEKPRGVETTSLINNDTICGRDKERNALVSKLCDEHLGLKIISIVGMGGIGKTTLAQLAYNDNKVKSSFGKRIWIYVSDPFDRLQVAKGILYGLEGIHSSSTTLQPVLEKIHQSIIREKFLLVLDDVWTEDYNDWESIQNCLNNCLNGSKIVVTTRKEKVALMLNSIMISVKELSVYESWSLFKRFAFFGRSNEECSELETIGKAIVGKCKGLPLATKTMGSFLRFKRTVNEWKAILDNEIWEFKGLEKDIFGPLFLSYNDLPFMVKRCFSYCAIFPKDYLLDRKELIQLWMAQGYLELEENRSMESVGNDYFDILATRSFFQEFVISDLGEIGLCKMHDIVHDFARFLTRHECFAMIDKDFGESNINISFDKARHLLLNVDQTSSFPISMNSFEKLRSLLFKFDLVFDSVDEVLLNLLGQNTYLRALSFGGVDKFERMSRMTLAMEFRFEKVPRVIGMLVHLRYLDLRNNSGLEVLPETLCELCNLQTLNITYCKNLKELPQGIGKLINLRHLVNMGCESLRYMPEGLESLASLRTLSEFHVGEGYHGKKVSSLKCLNKLHNLEGPLSLKKLGNMRDENEAHGIDLESKIKIRELQLDFNGWNSLNIKAAIKALQPPPSLQSLIISAYAGNLGLLSWTMLTSLKVLYLAELECEQLPLLKNLASLETLVIAGMKGVKRVGNEVLGLDRLTSSSSVTAFPKLKSLRFWAMEVWEEWDIRIEFHDVKVMSSLHFLEFRGCPELKALPKQLLQMDSLQVLVINNCPILTEKYQKGTGELWSEISHIPNIQIGGVDVQIEGH